MGPEEDGEPDKKIQERVKQGFGKGITVPLFFDP
jgi:hypothetical protein